MFLNRIHAALSAASILRRERAPRVNHFEAVIFDADARSTRSGLLRLAGQAGGAFFAFLAGGPFFAGGSILLLLSACAARRSIGDSCEKIEKLLGKQGRVSFLIMRMGVYCENRYTPHVYRGSEALGRLGIHGIVV